MFRGSMQDQKAMTEELRQVTMGARGLASRIELLIPMLTDAKQVMYRKRLEADRDNIDTAADFLKDLFSLAMKDLPPEQEAPDGPR